MYFFLVNALDKRQFLAHRGLHCSKKHLENSLSALIDSIKFGYGIETDLRDYLGEIYISHDPILEPQLTLREFLEVVSAVINSPTTIAFNIKSDGLAPKINDLMKNELNHSMHNIFYFDASVPDSISYINLKMKTYNRLSEHEPFPSFDQISAGSWIDSFDGSYDQIGAARKVINSQKPCVIVSPELHGRDYLPFWQTIRLDAKNLTMSKLFYLCTDFPDEAYEFFQD